MGLRPRFTKKTAALLVALAVLCAASVGAALAMLAAQGRSLNVVTLGNVEIRLNNSGAQAVTVTPTVPVEKKVSVTNDGGKPAYVRVKLDKYWVSAGSDTPAAGSDASLIRLLNGSADWREGADGYYYYQKVLPQGATTGDLCDAYAVSEKADNSYVGLSGTIRLSAEAVQSDYFTPDRDAAGRITGWGAVSAE